MKQLACLFVLLCHVGCASITGASTDRLRIVATPATASVRIDGESRGAAPLSVEVSKRGRALVEVTAPGYRTATCNTKMSPSGGYIAADVALCVFLFPFGCISFIDAAGAWNELDEPHCHVTLEPSATKPSTSAPNAS